MGKLTVKRVRELMLPGRYGDGDGLYLHIRSGGSRQWILRTSVQKRRRDIGLGSLSTVTLAEARDKAHNLRKLAKEGGDPTGNRNAKRGVPTFSTAAQLVWEQNRLSWKNPKHAQQWINSLREYAYPVIGEMPVDEIDSSHILRVLTPIWLEKPETARRLKQRMKTVFDWSKAAGYRDQGNPLEGVTDALPKQTVKVRHHKALPWAKLPKFMSELRCRSAISARALQFIVFTAARSGEAREATWSEIDFEVALWTVPAGRMKMRREHRVPLSPPAIDLLRQCIGLGNEIIFPSNNPDKPMSDMVFAALYKRMGYSGLTTHGFRSTFRDWCSEEAQASREIAEAALAHQTGNATERAYARSDLLGRRRTLMRQWSQFITSAGVD